MNRPRFAETVQNIKLEKQENFSKIIDSGKNNDAETLFRENSSSLVDYLDRNREKYPASLDKDILKWMQKYDHGCFFLHEYMRRPDDKNGARLGLSLLGDDCLNERLLAGTFKSLDNAGLLAGWLKTTLPSNLPPLPPPIPSNQMCAMRQYTDLSFKDLPFREAALHFRVHGKEIKRHLSSCLESARASPSSPGGLLEKREEDKMLK